MWPWEHAAFGYVLYSLYRRGRGRDAPRGRDAFAAVVAAVLPDLVDKPLSWGFGLFPSGYSVAHSVFVAALVVPVAVAAARRYGHGPIGVAVAVGYGSHLLGDVVYPALRGEGLALEAVLWPVVSIPPYETQYGFGGRTLRYVLRFVHEIASGAAGPALAVHVGLLLAVTALWVCDGMPGVPASALRSERE